jgi:hypothetical protein
VSSANDVDPAGSPLVSRKAMFAALLRLAVVSLALASGCAPTVYSVHVLPAARVVEEAEQAGAAEHAPYEYYFAQAHLTQARRAAAESAYQDAIRYAKVAAEHGRLAQRRARERMAAARDEGSQP